MLLDKKKYLKDLYSLCYVILNDNHIITTTKEKSSNFSAIYKLNNKKYKFLQCDRKLAKNVWNNTSIIAQH